MGKAIGIIALFVACVGMYGMGKTLSSDALAMSVGVLFGILASIPTALLMLVSGNRRSGDSQADYWRQQAIEAQTHVSQLEAQPRSNVIVLGNRERAYLQRVPTGRDCHKEFQGKE